MNATSRKKLILKLKNKKYRDAYVSAHVRNGIPYQIRALRDQRKWSQGELGKRSGKPQNVISRLEDPNYGKMSIPTLLDLAAAFDVALLVKFVPFSKLLSEVKDLSPEALSAKSFGEDQFEEEVSPAVPVQPSVPASPPTSTEVEITAQGIIAVIAGAASVTGPLVGTTVVLGKSVYESGLFVGTSIGELSRDFWQLYVHEPVSYRPINDQENLKNTEPIPTIENIPIAGGSAADELAIPQAAA